MRSRFVVVLALGLACSEDTGVLADAAAPECCEIGPQTCDCTQIGGTKVNGVCPTVCDSNPGQWQYGEDENGCPIVNTLGSCLPSFQDTGVRDVGDGPFGRCVIVPVSWVGEYAVTEISVVQNTESIPVGFCASIDFDQHLQNLQIAENGNFSGQLATDYLDTWRGCVWRAGSAEFLKVDTCDVECYGHDSDPRRLGEIETSTDGFLVRRIGRGTYSPDSSRCFECGPNGAVDENCVVSDQLEITIQYERLRE